MKIEKDNACDRVDTCEEACKAANIRAQKAEDEVGIILKIVIGDDGDDDGIVNGKEGHDHDEDRHEKRVV